MGTRFNRGGESRKVDNQGQLRTHSTSHGTIHATLSGSQTGTATAINTGGLLGNRRQYSNAAFPALSMAASFLSSLGETATECRSLSRFCIPWSFTIEGTETVNSMKNQCFWLSKAFM